jgi:hypothetical protein
VKSAFCVDVAPHEGRDMEGFGIANLQITEAKGRILAIHVPDLDGPIVTLLDEIDHPSTTWRIVSVRDSISQSR